MSSLCSVLPPQAVVVVPSSLGKKVATLEFPKTTSLFFQSPSIVYFVSIYKFLP
jgi:hypothetical protein